MFIIFPPKKPGPVEYLVLVLFIALVFIIIGIVAIVMGLKAPADKHELAVALEWRGILCMVTGLVIGFGYWLVRRLMDL